MVLALRRLRKSDQVALGKQAAHLETSMAKGENWRATHKAAMNSPVRAPAQGKGSSMPWNLPDSLQLRISGALAAAWLKISFHLTLGSVMQRAGQLAAQIPQFTQRSLKTGAVFPADSSNMIAPEGQAWAQA